MDWVYLIIGLIVGIFGGFVYFRMSVKTKLLEAEKAAESAAAALITEKSELETQKTVLTTRVDALAAEKETLLQKLEGESKTREEAETKVAVGEEAFQNLQEKLETERLQLEELEKKLHKEFENVANKILKQNTFEFNQTSSKNLQEVLSPLKEKIEKFETKVQTTYEKGLKDQTDLLVELKKLQDLSMRLDKDAQNLTNALKADTQKQGSWGEMILERILEESGLVKGQEYLVQDSGQNDEGRRLRPDVILKLPEEKHLIIDSKVSLTAYQNFVGTEDETAKERFIKKHIESVKNHVKELNEKNYVAIKGLNTPDFVLMFMPIEAAFATALQADPSLFNFAWERKIVIVSPTTLLATLRTIESIWRQEKQTRNALEIATQGGKLYDKFVGFLADLEKIGLNLNRASDAYQNAHKKLSSGNANILSQVERMKTLGAKTQKSIPQQLLGQED